LIRIAQTSTSDQTQLLFLQISIIREIPSQRRFFAIPLTSLCCSYANFENGKSKQRLICVSELNPIKTRANTYNDRERNFGSQTKEIEASTAHFQRESWQKEPIQQNLQAQNMVFKALFVTILLLNQSLKAGK
jgi:hypothetical protein